VTTAIPVLHLIVSTQPGGGPEHVKILARLLSARGFAPVIAGPRDGVLFDDLRSSGLDVVELRTDRLRAGTLRDVVQLVRARHVRVVHSHGKGAGLYGRLAARMTGVPAVHTFHGIHFDRYPRPARVAYLAMERTLARWTAAVVNVSHSEQAEGVRLGLFPPARSHVIPNGIDIGALEASALDRAGARRVLGLGPADFVVGSIARFDPVKALDLLVDAVGHAGGAHLVLIGRGADGDRLRRIASSLGARVAFPGEIPAASRLLRAVDVYATASAKEGLPLAVLEAMALGIPVVASDIPAHRELLGAGYPALVERTACAFARAMRELAADRTGRAALGEANRERARGFDASGMATAIGALYRELL
jgi:glycosyltransferase involved in cell wall biosynthesis